MVAMDEAPGTRNETSQAVVSDQREVQRGIEILHRKYSYYLTAANAILVVSVLIVALTFGHCFSAIEAAQRRKDIKELKDFGGPPAIRKVQWFDFVLLPRWAFLLAMVATILAAFAALPFSFALFFHEAVDDTKMKGLLSTTKVLIVCASYFLVFSLEALFFSFICSQWLAPFIDYQCARACEIALLVFCFCTLLFLVFNGYCYWRHKTEVEVTNEGP